jgi:hypothetical protein
MARWSLRKIAPLAAIGCAGLVATKAIGRRCGLGRRPVADPPDRHLAEDMMGALATSEGMPEVDEG